jgi:acetamidase/formamidase
MTLHVLPASPGTVIWGRLDPGAAPVLTVESGDEILIDTVSGGAATFPPACLGATIRPGHAEIARRLRPDPGPHVLTGPVAVRDAEPGDALHVEIREIALADDWGWNLVRPLAGALPDLVARPSSLAMAIDRARGLVHTPWGLDLPARPFFGVIGLAPPPDWGAQSSVAPHRHGGNIDCRDLVAGTRLTLPVMAPGALLHVGDGHALQGDGEVCLTAVETGLSGRLRLLLEKGAAPSLPFAETPGALVTFGFDPDLDRAAEAALLAMIERIGLLSGLEPEAAYRLCSLVVDLRITQVVNGRKGVHAVLPRAILTALGARDGIAGCGADGRHRS